MRLFGLLLLTTFWGGCAPSHDEYRARLLTLPHRYSQFDMALAWEVKAAGEDTVVEGVLKNLRYLHMDGVEVWVAVTDAAGKRRAQSVCYIIPRQLMQDELAPFHLKLPVSGEPGMLLRFTYKYQGFEGGEGGVSWMQSFDAELPRR